MLFKSEVGNGGKEHTRKYHLQTAKEEDLLFHAFKMCY